MSIEEVVAALEHVLEKARAITEQIGMAESTWSEGAELLSLALSGSEHDDAYELARINAHTADQFVRLQDLVNSVATEVGAIQARLRGSGAVVSSVVQRHSDVVVDVHQRAGPGVRGARTTGAWIREDGSTEVVSSGKSTGWYEATVQALTEVGGRALGLGLGTHAEMQFVVRMRREGLMHETLALDRAPCGTDPPVLLNQCHRRLPKVIGALLPQGATITIASPDGQQWEYSAMGRRRL